MLNSLSKIKSRAMRKMALPVSGIITAITFVAVLGMPATANVVPEDAASVDILADSSLILFGMERNAPPVTFELAFSDSNTNKFVSRLKDGERECGGLPEEYRADCLSQTYRNAAGAGQGAPDYSQASSELNNASRSIGSVVSQNVDPAAQPIKKGFRTYRAVKKSAVKTVNAKAKAIIAETETRLLRSASSGHRKTHYQRIAQAVGSTKRILRS